MATDPAPELLCANGFADRFGALVALHPLDLDVAAGALVLLGPSLPGRSGAALLWLASSVSEPCALADALTACFTA